MICQNICVFSGRAGKDPESISVGESTVIKFPLAIDSPKRLQDGSWDSNTSWAALEDWEQGEATIGNRIRKIGKGDVVSVHCTYRTNKKEIDGVNRTFYSFKIQNVFLTETKKQETEDNIPYE